MKRVGIPCRPRAQPLISPATSDATEEPDSDRSARRRKLDDKVMLGEVSFQEIPPMATELIFNQAKTDVISHISNHPTLNKFHDNRYTRPANCRGVKRNVDGETVTGGQGWKMHLEHMTALRESWADLGLLPQQSDEEEYRDIRTYPAACGVPDLSIIADDESESEISQIRPMPQPASAAATSPAKRKARLDNYSRTNLGLGSTLVKLNPGITPASILTSPIKSQTSPPRDAPAVSSAISLNENITLEPKLPQLAMNLPPHGPAKGFKPSLYSEPTTVKEVGTSSPMTPQHVPSPTKRPGAPTPSRWSRSPLATPHFGTPATQQRNTPLRPLGIVDSICPSTPNLDGVPPTWESNPEMFDFGEISDIQMSPRIDWLRNDASESKEATRTQNVNKSRRRKSEPILNRHLKKLGASRRQSDMHQVLSSLTDDHDDVTQASPGLQIFEAQTALPASHETDVSTPTHQQEPGNESLTASSRVGSAGPITPFSKYFLERQPLSVVKPAGTRSDRNGIYSIDMRQNPDIFNSRVVIAPAVEQLADLAGESCDGYANVVVTQSSGKLVVRFKLPTKYASLFPQSQVADEPHLESVSSPHNAAEISRNIHQAVDKTSSNNTPTPSPHKRMTRTGLGIMDSAFTPGNLVGTSSPLKKVQFPSSPANEDSNDQTLVVGDFDMELDMNETPLRSNVSPVLQSSEFRTPARPSQNLDVQAPSSGLISDLSIEPSFQTPTFANIDFSPALPGDSKATPCKVTLSKATPSKQPSASSRRNTPSESKVKTPSVSPDRDISAEAQVKTSPGGTPLATSFTPVNKNSPRNSGAVPTSGRHSPRAPTPSQEACQTGAEEPVAPKQPTTNEHASKKTTEQNLDSPGREYMRAFIRNMKPKRLSTTETGSPIAHSPARVPLEAKSPNAGNDSPKKLKRKQGVEGDSGDSPAKKSEEPAVKRIRRLGNLSKEKSEESQPKRKAKPSAQKSVVEKDNVHSPHKQEPKEVASEEGPCRRSSRLNTQEKKSSIPTSIKLGRPTAGREPVQGKLNSAVRNEQAELTRQTNLNTKRNKGKAESVQQILARVSEELSEGESNDSASDGSTRKKAKNVTWRTPLESHQGEKTKRGRPAGTLGKKKATQGEAGVSKPKATPQKPRISKVAAQSLGMAGNGTPAKRMTRARTRSQN
ncbi:unnamed protein product [Clonostachys byssicola]|uniref:Uncharacterized protein n=1 Tax=Clonostachys byssicola TaxID=160290 RepID=A0A9N9UK13_9HYPO|nr:unnamed protein product [Clonostachys byssicola]